MKLANGFAIAAARFGFSSFIAVHPAKPPEKVQKKLLAESTYVAYPLPHVE